MHYPTMLSAAICRGVFFSTGKVKRGPYGWSVEEVSLAGIPTSSLQGCIHGVFRNRLPIRVRVVLRFRNA